jgi:hypothetical protein
MVFKGKTENPCLGIFDTEKQARKEITKMFVKKGIVGIIDKNDEDGERDRPCITKGQILSRYDLQEIQDMCSDGEWQVFIQETTV